MEKLEGMSLDLTKLNIEKLKELFPMIDVDGKIDFEMLRTILGDEVDDSREKYQFTWNGKTDSIKLAQSPSSATLRPCKKESKDWDTTENLYIEGDNLEVLKQLQKTYYGKVKMIYIDPPYNTGNDFIYKDDFKDSIKNYKEQTEQGMSSNPETNGRYHTDWLNMMYPRLVLAKNLLTDDGVIFISIDDNEVENMIKIGNEIFGESNFINIITVRTKIGGVSGSSEGKSLKDATEFICIWSRNKESLILNPIYIKTKLSDRIQTYKDEGKSWKYTSLISELDDKVLIKEDKERKMKYYGYRILNTKSISTFARENNITEEEVYNKYADRIYQTTNAQSSIRQTVIKETNGETYPMIGLEYIPTKGKNVGKTIEVLYKGDSRRMMMFLSDSLEKINEEYYYLDKITSLWDDIEYNNLSKEGNIEFKNGKKPLKLLQRMIELGTSDDSIILDFFSGSASTAHAIIQINSKNGEKRRFIMVQLPEEIDNNTESYKNGYKNICEIGKERIRRSGELIKKEYQESNPNKEFATDIGFKVFKLDSTNIKPWENTRKLDIKQLSYLEEVFKNDRSKEDVLYEILLKYGLFDMSVSEVDINGKTMYRVGRRYMIVCLENDITTRDIKEIIELSPRVVVFKETGFNNDNDKINAEYNLKKAGIEEIKCI
jgi:adenine-specific DNA-methyltransferase